MIIKIQNKVTQKEAIQWNGNNKKEIFEFVTDSYIMDENIIIPTLEGDMVVCINDWIIKGLNGEFYPCKPGIFEKSYEVI